MEVEAGRRREWRFGSSSGGHFELSLFAANDLALGQAKHMEPDKNRAAMENSSSPFLICLLLVAATLAVYWPAIIAIS